MITLSSTSSKNYNEAVFKNFDSTYSFCEDKYVNCFGELNNKDIVIKNLFIIENKKFNYSLGINSLIKLLNKKNINSDTPIMITDCSTYIGQRSLKKLISDTNFDESFVTINTLKRDLNTIPVLEKSDVLTIQGRYSYFNKKIIKERENSFPVLITNLENLLCLNGLEETIPTELSRFQIIQKLKNLGIKEIVSDFYGLNYTKNSIPKNFKLSEDNNINNKDLGENWGVLQIEKDVKINKSLPIIEEIINVSDIKDNNYSDTDDDMGNIITSDYEKDKDFLNYYDKIGIIISSSSKFSNHKNWKKFHIFINNISNYHKNIDILEYDIDNKKAVDFNAIKDNKNLNFRLINKDNEESLKDYELIITHQNTKLLDYIIDHKLNCMIFVTDKINKIHHSSDKINKIEINKNTTSKIVTDFLIDDIYEKYTKY